MEVLSGNASDKKSLVASIERATKTLASLNTAPICAVADSAFYTAENIRCLRGAWISRGPATLGEAQEFLSSGENPSSKNGAGRNVLAKGAPPLGKNWRHGTASRETSRSVRTPWKSSATSWGAFFSPRRTPPFSRSGEGPAPLFVQTREKRSQPDEKADTESNAPTGLSALYPYHRGNPDCGQNRDGDPGPCHRPPPHSFFINRRRAHTLLLRKFIERVNFKKFPTVVRNVG